MTFMDTFISITIANVINFITIYITNAKVYKIYDVKMDLDDKELISEDGSTFEKTLEKIVRKVLDEKMTPIEENIEKLLFNKEYTITEVARKLGVTHVTVRSYIKKGLLDYNRYGITYKITQRQLSEFVKNQGKPRKGRPKDSTYL